MKTVDSSKNLIHEVFRIRMIEEAMAKRYPEQQMRCPMHLCIGQEAIAVGVCSQLRQRDMVIGGHRSHAPYLAKGGDLKKLLAEMHGKATGCCGGRGGSMHLVDLDVNFMGSTPIVGGSFPVGVGLAFASYLKKEDRLTAIFFGEGATEEGVFAESINFAALKKLPVLFVCENNFFSVTSPISVRQPKERSIVALAEAHGIIARSAEGSNVQDVSNIVKEAVDSIRAGGGPVLLEFLTYRYLEHCGFEPDPILPREELEYWKKKDPLFTTVFSEEIKQEIENEIEEAFAFALSSPFPTPVHEGEIYA